MKNIAKILSIVIIGLLFSIDMFGQATANANASATIVTPISISRTSHMSFGNVAVNAAGGTVVLPAALAPVRSATAGCTLPAITGTVSSAAFTVSGVDGYTYSITLPSTDHTITDGTNNMTVNTFTSSPTPTGTLTGGSQTLYVGATLVVPGSAPAGTYTSATPFDVTVNYN